MATGSPTNANSCRPLSPWRPQDYLRLLWWVLVDPSQLKLYLETYGEGALRRVSKWLLSTLTWLPFIIINLALTWRALTETPPQPERLWTNIGFILAWSLTGWLGDKKNILGFIVRLITDFIRQAGIPFVAAINIVATVNLLTDVPGDPTMLGIVAFIVYTLLLIIAYLTERKLKESVRTGRPSRLVQGSFGVFLLTNIVLCWWGFIGWRLVRWK